MDAVGKVQEQFQCYVLNAIDGATRGTLDKNLNGINDFGCLACVWRANVEYLEKEYCVIEVGQTFKEAEYFQYLEDALDYKGGIERAVRASVATAQTNWREFGEILLDYWEMGIFHQLIYQIYMMHA